jgi:preprotein translocase SecE subunit
VVYRDGLKPLWPTAIVQILPSPTNMKDYSNLIILVVIVLVAFGFAWRKGYLLRLTNYVHETREELRKCTWSTVDELKGSTVLVMISIILLGTFTSIIDFVVINFVRAII